MAVVDAGNQARGYLWGTKELGLKYLTQEEDEMVLNVFTDASYAPNAEESHGCCIVMVGASPIFWKSGRQSTVTLSTAEAELNEVVEGMTAGESTAVILDELVGRLPRMAWTRAIDTHERGSWRTRHLRLRSAFARQSIQEGEWTIGHTPGEDMVADTGTKALTSTRLIQVGGFEVEDDDVKASKEEGRTERRRRKDYERR